MSHRQVVEQKLAKKLTEVQSLEDKLRTARIYLLALQDVLRAIESDDLVEAVEVDDRTLRKGSMIEQARSAILKFGKPVYIDDLLLSLGKEVTRETKASLAGSLAAYVRREEVFTRPAPSTFGVVEFGAETPPKTATSEPPSSFGMESSINFDDEIPF